MLTIDEIVAATKAPLANVLETWPLVTEALEAEGIRSHAVELAAAATIGVETYGFTSQEERGEEQYFTRYDGRMGNTDVGDGYRYRGRGIIQLTGRNNYRTYGRYLTLKLEEEPSIALEPKAAARIFAAYFKLRSVYAEAEKGNWKRVRILVNGGLNGWDKFKRILVKLGVDDSLLA